MTPSESLLRTRAPRSTVPVLVYVFVGALVVVGLVAGVFVVPRLRETARVSPDPPVLPDASASGAPVTPPSVPDESAAPPLEPAPTTDAAPVRRVTTTTPSHARAVPSALLPNGEQAPEGWKPAWSSPPVPSGPFKLQPPGLTDSSCAPYPRAIFAAALKKVWPAIEACYAAPDFDGDDRQIYVSVHVGAEGRPTKVLASGHYGTGKSQRACIVRTVMGLVLPPPSPHALHRNPSFYIDVVP